MGAVLERLIYEGLCADRCGLYAPSLLTREQIVAVVEAVAPKPVNLLVGWASDPSLADIAALGVRRVSVGGALAGAAWHAFMHAARQIATEGRFDAFVASPGRELNPLFRGWPSSGGG